MTESEDMVAALIRRANRARAEAELAVGRSEILVVARRPVRDPSTTDEPRHLRALRPQARTGWREPARGAIVAP